MKAFTVAVIKGDKFNNKKHPGRVNAVFKDLGIDILGAQNHNSALVYDVRSKCDLCESSRRMVLKFMIETAIPCEDVYIFRKEVGKS